MRHLGFYTSIACLLLIACQELPWYLRGEPAQQKEISPPPSAVEKNEPPLASSRGRLLVEAAKTFIGSSYRFGGTSHTGIDCSGLIYAASKKAGRPIHRTTTRRMMSDYKKSSEPPKQGDLPLFSHNKGITVAHVGIWDDHVKMTMVHASSSKGVIVSTVNKHYWLPRLVVTKEIP